MSGKVPNPQALGIPVIYIDSSRAWRGQASHRATHETHRQPRCVGERRGEASKRAGEPPGAVALEKGLLLGLHTIITTYLALTATTSMPSRLAVVVERAR